MKEIVKVLLQEGIDEETIHEVLDTIQERVIDYSTLEPEYAKERKALADKMAPIKAVRRNTEKVSKQLGLEAKKMEKKADVAMDKGKERKAEYYSDKAGELMDQQTQHEEKGMKAQRIVDKLKDRFLDKQEQKG